MDEEQKLQALRKRIDEIDAQLQQLISERGKLALEVAHTKQGADQGETEQANFYRPEREAQVLRRVIERNQGPLADEDMARLFREIMSICLALEEPMTIAYFGPEGTYTQAAALKHFGHAVTTKPLNAINDVFREVEAGSAHYGVVPVENSTEGVVNHTLDMFMQSSLKICGEVETPVHHNLLSKQEDTAQLSRIYSHQQSLAQCREWLDNNMPGIERVAVSSNGEAARLAAQEEGVAAIAGTIAAELYGLKILQHNIEDQPGNTTRFLVIGREDTPPSGKDKTSLLVSTMNKPGALSRLLQAFSNHDVSMTRIESRPSRVTMWDYVFFIDVEGHVQDATVAAALQELEQASSMLKILGSYPKAVL
jgi:chorismate mutase/prephenate dehydratase